MTNVERARAALAGASLRLAGDRRGAVIVEFALVLPFLLFSLLVAVDGCRYLMTVDKVHRAAATAADLVARADGIHEADVRSILSAVAEVTKPVDLAASGGGIILSSVSRLDRTGGRKVSWQRRWPATLAARSLVGVEGGAPTLPAGFDLGDDDNAIFAEAFHTFSPMLLGGGILAGPTAFRVYERIVFHPRLGTLSSIQP